MALLFRELGFRRGAEIGVRLGHYSAHLCRAGLDILAVDIWEDEAIYRQAKAMLSQFRHCRLVRKSSIEAAASVSNGSLDVVYIDADHHYDAVMKDLETWIPKVRPGGIIAGHDYHDFRPDTCQVMQAVNHWVSIQNIKPLFIAAKEREPSWFWVK